MSLSRILNDEPSPHQLVPSGPTIDPALTSPTPQAGPRSSPRPHQGYPDYNGEVTPPLRSIHGVAYKGTGGWDPYGGEWIQGDIFPGGGSHYSRPERLRSLSPHDLGSGYYRQGETDTSSRKRRRDPEEDDDARELSQGRVRTNLDRFWTPLMILQNGPRKYAPHNKQFHPEDTPSVDGHDVEPKVEDLPQPSEEELRLASSDLDDCEEVWIGELSEYILETHKRQKQVELWFDASVLVSDFISFLVKTNSTDFTTGTQLDNGGGYVSALRFADSSYTPSSISTPATSTSPFPGHG